MTKKEKITKLTLDDKTSIKINLQQNLQLKDVSIIVPWELLHRRHLGIERRRP